MSINGMQENNSNRIINTLLLSSVALALVSLAWVYLPDKLNEQSLMANPKSHTKATRLLPPLQKKKEENQTVKIIQGNIPDLSKEISSKKDVEKKRPQRSTEPEWLTVPKGLEREVDFWLKVYTKYDTHTAVMHDPLNLDIVYGTVDLKDIDDNEWLTDQQKWDSREKRTDAAKNQILSILERLEENPPTENMSEEERRIRFLFSKINDPVKFKKAVEMKRVRAQIGQSDKFREAIAISGAYMDEIEKIFKSYNLPIELTRLIFVESMFNVDAASSVGAKGIWQFMLGTGKLYLKINSYIDERKDPYYSTHAAAKLLLNNYESLGTWPLAINAYNAGKGRLKAAVEALNTTNIVKIIRSYQHPSYGFASRNFVAEFLAAHEAYRNRDRYFDAIEKRAPLSFEEVSLSYNIFLPEVATLAQIDINEIKKLNPSLSNAVFSGSLYVPAGFRLRIPRGKSDLVNAISSRAPKSYPGPLKHKVSSEDTLMDLSDFFSVSVEELKTLNNLESEKLLPGQEIKIPTTNLIGKR